MREGYLRLGVESSEKIIIIAIEFNPNFPRRDDARLLPHTPHRTYTYHLSCLDSRLRWNRDMRYGTAATKPPYLASFAYISKRGTCE